MKIQKSFFDPTTPLGDRRIVVDLASRRISARIASFNDAHSGFKGAIKSPKNVNVEAAHVGHAQLDDGSSLAVATLPMHTMHAGQNLTAAHAAAWYENTGTAVARVRYSIDDDGIRADGVLFDDVSDADLDRLTAAAPSGDWRAASLVRRPEDFENSRADFAGACIVNMPGYSGTYSQSPATPLRLVASGLDEILLTDISEEDQFTLTAAALGIADRAKPWDSGAAQQRVKDYATSGGKVDFAKYGQAFLYNDPSKPEQLTAYKLQFADVVNGKLVIIPRAVFAVAAVLQGARGGVDLGSQAAHIKSRTAALYKSISRKFNDPSIVAPWDKGSALKAAGYDISQGDVIQAWADQNQPPVDPSAPQMADAQSPGWSVEDFYVQPPSIVVCDLQNDGGYYQVPWSIGADGSISFGQQAQVEQTWAPVGGNMPNLVASGDNKGDCSDGECCGGACKGDALTAAANLLAEHAAANETTVDALVAAAAPYDAKAQIEGLGAQISDLTALVASMADLLD